MWFSWLVAPRTTVTCSRFTSGVPGKHIMVTYIFIVTYQVYLYSNIYIYSNIYLSLLPSNLCPKRDHCGLTGRDTQSQGPFTGVDSRPGGLFNSGYPRMLLTLVLEFESHRGEISFFFWQKNTEKRINC